MTRQLIAAILALTMVTACKPASSPAFRSSEISVDWGGDITLTAHTGKRLSTADFRGKILLLFFGYTNCPDVCPTTLSKLAAVHKALGNDADRVQVFFITVDPMRDTPARLAAFVPKFDPSFIGLTGSSAAIAAIANDYKVPYVSPAKGAKSYNVPHSTNVLVKDGGGKVRLLFDGNTSVDDMIHDLKQLIAAASA